jgi:hypothetical protein
VILGVIVGVGRAFDGSDTFGFIIFVPGFSSFGI